MSALTRGCGVLKGCGQLKTGTASSAKNSLLAYRSHCSYLTTIWTVPFCSPGNTNSLQSALGQTSHKPATFPATHLENTSHMQVLHKINGTSWVWACGYGGEHPGVVRETEHVDFCHQNHDKSDRKKKGSTNQFVCKRLEPYHTFKMVSHSQE